jgi:hypothetical protein
VYQPVLEVIPVRLQERVLLIDLLPVPWRGDHANRRLWAGVHLLPELCIFLLQGIDLPLYALRLAQQFLFKERCSRGYPAEETRAVCMLLMSSKKLDLSIQGVSISSLCAPTRFRRRVFREVCHFLCRDGRSRVYPSAVHRAIGLLYIPNKSLSSAFRASIRLLARCSMEGVLRACPHSHKA